ncbi:MAG: GxxExxY protein, partial [Leptospira sp.]|nr:GxxExxY protein [Leptospira sp.]
IIELKAVTKLANEHYAQLRNYLSASNFEVGFS